MDSFHLQLLDGHLVLGGEGVARLATEINKSAIPPHQKSVRNYHLRVISRDELTILSEAQKQQLVGCLPQCHRIYCAGIGKAPASHHYYLIIIWAEGQQLRKSVKLPPAHFYISLTQGTQLVEITEASIHTLCNDTFPQQPTTEFLDHLIFTLHLFHDHSTALPYCEQMLLTEAQDDTATSRGFLRLADAAFNLERYKLAMLSYARAFEQNKDMDDDRISTYCLKKLEKCSQHTEWAAILQDFELQQIPRKLTPLLLQPWSVYLKSAIEDLAPTPTLCIESRQRLYIPALPSNLACASTLDAEYYKMPRFFRWVVPFCIAAMSTPRNEEDITVLAAMGIRTVLTLTEETPLPDEWFDKKSIKNIFMPVPNYHPPSLEQMNIVISLVNDDSNLPLLVHCGGGKGRAGTVIACYLVAYGYNRPCGDREHPAMTANEAIASIRSLRPSSLETSQQEDFVRKWCSAIWKRQALFPDRPSEPPPCKLNIQGSLEQDANLFILVGLPGSGKSWISQALLARNRKGWKRISQDESGSRTTCETEIGSAPASSKTRILLDRCNAAAADRRQWLGLASNWMRNPVCVWFDYDKELCTSRAQARVDHATLPPGGRVRSAIEQMQKIFVRPELSEGFKAILIIRSFEAASELVARLSPPVAIYKFPRTSHLLDLGAATSDDVIDNIASFRETTALLELGSNVTSDQKVVITEKIDGANMGFSLSADRMQIVVQNRSHYVNTASHEQFKKLGHWVETHREELMKLLDRDPFFAQRYILYGEWMYATHSIHYTRLPDLFIAFDLFDRSTETFVDRATLQFMLTQHNSGITLVPVMLEANQVPSEAKLKQMVQQQSQFWDGRVEGVYVKWEAAGIVARRGKIVRADFIAGNEHWSKKNLQPNQLAILDP